MSDYAPEIVYASEGKAPNGEPFLTVKRARGYYEYAERPGRDSIAFILYDSARPACIGLIYEAKPPLDESTSTKAMLTTAFGGSIDSDLTPQLICQTEVLEEAGYVVPIEHIHLVGHTYVSTQSSQRMYAYLVDITGISKTALTETESLSDHSIDPDEFSRNRTMWMNPLDLFSNDDWKSIYIWSKATVGGVI